MFALVDVNSFYTSCETVWRPDLSGKPVVVLSNNDGCIVSRSAEAKALGIGMAEPYFKQKDLLQRHGVAVFSSNYAWKKFARGWINTVLMKHLWIFPVFPTSSASANIFAILFINAPC